MHPDVPVFALSQQVDNTSGAIKGDMYTGAVQDWLKLPVDASEVIARVEGALRHQVRSPLMLLHLQVLCSCNSPLVCQSGFSERQCVCLKCFVDLQYRVVKKLRNEVLALKGDIDTLQRLQQENHQPDKMLSQNSM